MCQKPSEASSLLSKTWEGGDKPRLNPLAEPYAPPHFAFQKLRLHQFQPPHLVFSGWVSPSPVHYYLNPQLHTTLRPRPIRYGEHVTPKRPHPVFGGDLGKKLLGKMEVPRTPFCKERKRSGVRSFMPPRSMRERQRHGNLISSSGGGRKWVQKQHDSCDENKHDYGEAVLGKALVVAENATDDDVAREDPEVVLNGSTTVMIRNIPNQFKRKDLLYILDKHCDEANAMADSKEDQYEYDFVYVPVDFKTKANKGYAFVNFTNPIGASRLYQAYHNFRWECLPIKNLNFRSKKVCEISPAKIQGKVALECTFKNRAFPCREYQPVVATETPGNGRQKNGGLLIEIGKCPGAPSARETRAEATMVIAGEQFGGCDEAR
ncbi:protein terminal ear1 homolog [Eucalyptus grandis]|uniref:protein terminal ear1 homolog n=1 Tax=Eucalyptus grandis TaxID=71139 RepID=UPI00192EB36D|nr:protein terminal ear1 homolog [Eucalyptus grandis]